MKIDRSIPKPCEETYKDNSLVHDANPAESEFSAILKEKEASALNFESNSPQAHKKNEISSSATADLHPTTMIMQKRTTSAKKKHDILSLNIIVRKIVSEASLVKNRGIKDATISFHCTLSSSEKLEVSLIVRNGRFSVTISTCSNFTATLFQRKTKLIQQSLGSKNIRVGDITIKTIDEDLIYNPSAVIADVDES